MKIVDKISEEGIHSVSETEYFHLVERAEDHLEGVNLIEKDWNEFMVVGDTHGELEAARKPAEHSYAEDVPIVYLGDYVDRGKKQLENLAYLLSMKMERPEKMVLLRGNHETRGMNLSYGFQQVVGKQFSSHLFERIVSLYRKIPAAGVVGKKYYLAHGGIPKGVKDHREINELKPGGERYREIFWNDPSEEIEYFEPNFKRGAYRIYGRKAVESFLENSDLKMMIRAHEVQQSGYRYYFDGKLLSLFSISNYHENNKGKYAHVKDEKIELIDN